MDSKLNQKIKSVQEFLMNIEPWKSSEVHTPNGVITGVLTDSERTDILECLQDNFTVEDTINFMLASKGILQQDFDTLFNWLQENADSVKEIKHDGSWRFAQGEILGYPFRLFEEPDNSAWCGIQDNNASGTKCPAFYNEFELDNWYLQNQ